MDKQEEEALVACLGTPSSVAETLLSCSVKLGCLSFLKQKEMCVHLLVICCLRVVQRAWFGICQLCILRL